MFRNKTSSLYIWTWTYQPWEAVSWKLMQQPPELTTIQASQLQSMEAKYKATAVVEEESVTKYVEDKARVSTAHHTRHKFETSIKN